MTTIDGYEDNFDRDENEGPNVYDASGLFTEWRRKLILNQEKQPKACLANALTALREAPEFKGVLRYNDFAHTPFVSRATPWDKREDFEPRPWEDYDDARVTEWLQREGIMVKTGEAAAAAMAVAKESPFHPVREYLEGLKWDGINRIEDVMLEVFGCEDTPYARSVFKCFLIGAVARIYKPGCKMDNVIILEGQQGVRKSTAVGALFDGFFSDDIADLGSKDAAMQARGVWCIELAELSSMGKTQTEQVKAFITRRVDRFRPSYGRHVIEAPRECVFIGTTNSDHYLKDETGGRRFWPIRCAKVNIALLERMRDALWAEARNLYELGEVWWFTDEEVIDAARDEQEQRFQGDPWTPLIAKYVATKRMATVSEILTDPECLGMEKARQRSTDNMRVGAIMTKMGWIRKRVPVNGVRAWAYVAPELTA